MRTKLNEALNERKDYLVQLSEQLEESLKTAPPGNLRISSDKGKLRYYHVTVKGSHCGKYLKEENRGLAIRLAQKDYESKVLKRAREEIDIIDSFRLALGGTDINGVFDSLSIYRKNLVRPVELSDEAFVSEWLSRDYERMGFKEGEPAYDTVNGARVRSKSEALISNTLERNEVPQLYEMPLVLEGYGKVRPDFTVLNVCTRKEFIWEHLGILDDPAYLANAMKKIEAYIANGYIPGVNLIITFESGRHPLDLKTVERLIDEYLK